MKQHCRRSLAAKYCYGIQSLSPVAMSPSCSPSTVLFVSNTEFDTENKKTPNNCGFSNTELDTEKTKHE